MSSSSDHDLIVIGGGKGLLCDRRLHQLVRQRDVVRERTVVKWKRVTATVPNTTRRTVDADGGDSERLTPQLPGRGGLGELWLRQTR